MAYHGIKEIRFNVYIDKSIKSGWRYGKFHTYVCEQCGREANVIGKATERFYCGDCGELINIEPKELQCDNPQRQAIC